ncbi:MAG: hypothetical protein EPN93_03290 [Spirochaetes bacterium]|nr:MAG: hypothetical protein EPN93_03290 [Spirochaetota bacterium]
MIDPGTGPTESIPLDRIDFSDSRFRIGRIHREDALARSVEMFGILCPPTLLATGNDYVIISGHNRLEAARAVGTHAAECTVCQTISPRIFMKHALLKAYRGALGPAGKLRSVQIARSLGADEIELGHTAIRGLGIPDEIYRDHAFISGVRALPGELLRYIDQRDIGFKPLKSLMRLPAEGIGLIAQWVEEYYLRLNIFRDALELMLDIYRKKGSIEEIAGILPRPGADPHAEEERLHEALFRIRYPEYSGIIAAADSIRERYRDRGVSLVLPSRLEGGSVEARISFGRKDSIEKIGKAIGSIAPGDIRSLLDLLS